MARYPLEWGWHTDPKNDTDDSSSAEASPATQQRYPLEWGWDPPGSDTPALSRFTPVMQTLLGGADPETVGKSPPVQLVQANRPANESDEDNELTFDTVQPDRPRNPSYTNGWYGNWLLKYPSRNGGLIVQKIIHTLPSGKSLLAGRRGRSKRATGAPRAP
ncbi:MAG TPA: hypothetical protein VFB13_03425 [Reyranella sp.]|jgi:hypothetical protein|nr:hypothetical protein [Reyranella sp.]